MKIGLITYNRAHSYGAVLQCYATNKKLQDLEVEFETIDYNPYFFRKMYYLLCKFTSLRHPGIKSRLYKLFIYKTIRNRTKNFENFIEKNFNLSSKQYMDFDDINRNCNDYDVYITGSDQVWNSVCGNFDKVFFLDFDDAKVKKRYSFAASFGMTSIPIDLLDEYRSRLNGYENYSVREKTGAKLIRELTGKQAIISCDPTFMLMADEWKSIEDVSYVPSNPYVLVYYVTPTKDLQKAAQKLAKEKNLDVVCVPCYLSYEVLSGKNDREFKQKFFPSCSPEGFIALCHNASYVLTNSFHGTVFSVIFQKSFISQYEITKGEYNNRSQELLEQLEITNRDLTEDLENIDEPIDWDNVAHKISSMRREAINYLEAIGGKK